MRIKLEIAQPKDAAEICALRIATAKKLTEVHSNGPWSPEASEKWILFAMRNSSVLVARRRGKIIATLALGTKKPWAIDRDLAERLWTKSEEWTGVPFDA